MPQSQLMINSGVLEILFPPNVWVLSNSVVLISESRFSVYSNV